MPNFRALHPILCGSRPTFAIVAFAVIAFCAFGFAYDEIQTAFIVSIAIVSFVGTGLWFIARGRAWARWVLTFIFAAVGLWAVLYGVPKLLLSADSEDHATVAIGFLFIITAASLFSSDALDELTGIKNHSGIDGWDAVSAPEQRVVPATPVIDSSTKIFRRRFWGSVAGGVATVTTVTAWIAFLAVTLWLFSNAPGLRISGDGMWGLASILVSALVAGMIFLYIVGSYLLLFVVPFRGNPAARVGPVQPIDLVIEDCINSAV